MHRALAAVLVLAIAALAWCDGLVVPGVAIVKPVRTPDQRALVRFDGTTETLVIETTLQGEGRDFAWILPLPAPPTIEASTTGLFPTLELVTAPEVIERTKGDDRGWAVLVAFGVGLWKTIRFWRRPLPPGPALLVTPGLVLLALMYFVAGIGCSARMKSADDGANSAVTVLARQQVGAFDTATLDARDPAALRTWLSANGFRAPEGIDPVVAAYLKEGWVFVASKVRREVDDDAVRRIHPLAFSFPAKEAVYPMRLTGAANDSVALELFVFGDRRAEADGLVVECCDDASRLIDESRRYSPPHAELRRRAAGAIVVTKLSGTLDRTAMAEDVHLGWTRFRHERRVLYSSRMALERAFAPGAGALALLLVAAAIASRRRGAPFGRPDLQWIFGAVLVACATVATVWWLTPRLPEGSRVAGWKDGVDLEHPPESVRGDASALRAWAAETSRGAENPVTGEPIREEDSPGNWTVREVDGRLELVLTRFGFGNLEEHVVDASRAAEVPGSVRTGDGRPIANAQVHVTRADLYGEIRPARTLHAIHSPLDVTTDGDGRFTLRVPVGRTWHLWAEADGQPFLVRPSVALPPKDGAAIDLVLPRARTIRGRAFDAAGQPLPWAVVFAERSDTFGIDWRKEATTAFDGTFEFRGFEADADVQVSLHVHEPKHCDETQHFTLGPASPPVELRLRGR